MIFTEQINKELSRVLLKESEESEKAFSDNDSRPSKIRAEFESVGLLFSTEGKKNIKQSPKSIPRKPKAGGEEIREGYHIVYSLTHRVEEYRKTLSNPQAVCIINERLLRHGILKEAYDVVSKTAFDTVIIGEGLKSGQFLHLF